MMDGKTFYNLFSEKLGFDESAADFVYNAFLSELQNRLESGKTIEIEGVGFFKRKDADSLIFVSAEGNEEKLYEEINLPAIQENEFELNENVFAVGGNSPILPAEEAADSDKISSIEKTLNSLSEQIDSFSIIDDFDPIEYSQSKNETEETNDSWHEELKEELLSEDLFDDEESIDENTEPELNSEENTEEESGEEDSEIVEELNAEINDAPDAEEENEIPSEEEKNEEEASSGEEKENLKNDVIEQEDLDKVFGDVEDSDSEEKEETPGKDKEEKKKRFKFFGKKKDKKENKKDKSKKTDDPEKTETGESEEKRKLSKKLIILIAVFAVVTLAGVYFFFFTGGNEEERGEGEKTEVVDSAKAERTPITPEELGETKDKTGKIEVDVHHPEKTKTESSYDVVDPRLIKKFPNEKKLTNKIYFANGKYMVQLSSWRDSERASQIVNKLYENGFNAFVVKAYLPQLGGTWYRVRIGFFDTLKEAKDFLRKREYLYVR